MDATSLTHTPFAVVTLIAAPALLTNSCQLASHTIPVTIPARTSGTQRKSFKAVWSATSVTITPITAKDPKNGKKKRQPAGHSIQEESASKRKSIKNSSNSCMENDYTGPPQTTITRTREFWMPYRLRARSR